MKSNTLWVVLIITFVILIINYEYKTQTYEHMTTNLAGDACDQYAALCHDNPLIPATYTNNMKKYCAQTCSVCQDHNEHCEALKGFCGDAQYNDIMNFWCPKTCGVCSDSPTPTPKQIPAPAITQPKQITSAPQPQPAVRPAKKWGILVAGQSNAIGTSQTDFTNRLIWDNRIKMWDRSKKMFVSAQNPMPHFTLDKNGEGFVTQFSKLLLRNNKIQSNDELYIFPCAFGGSGIFLESSKVFQQPYSWDPDTTGWWSSYGITNLVQLTKKDIEAAKAQIPNLEFLCTLWHQGEADNIYCSDNTGQYRAWKPNQFGVPTSEPPQNCYKKYQQKLSQIINKIRSFTNNAPFLLGTLSKSPYTQMDEPINLYIRNTANTINGAYIVEISNSDVGAPFSGIDQVHFSAAQQRQIGQLYFNKFSQIQ